MRSYDMSFARVDFHESEHYADLFEKNTNEYLYSVSFPNLPAMERAMLSAANDDALLLF